jgi:signal transduction histidine kinase
MGELTASMAHELNQPLAAILSNAQAASRFLGAKPPDLEQIRECLTDVADDKVAGESLRGYGNCGGRAIRAMSGFASPDHPKEHRFHS